MRSTEGTVFALMAAAMWAAAEGWRAARGAFDLGGGAFEAALSFAASFAVVFSFLFPVAFGLLWLGFRQSSRSMLSHMAAGFGGNDLSASIALIGWLLAVGVSFLAAVLVGLSLSRYMTHRFAMIGEAAVQSFVLAVALLVAPSLGRLLGALSAKLSRLAIFTRVAGMSAVLLALAAALYFGIAEVLPAEWALSPAVAVMGLSIASIPAFRRRLASGADVGRVSVAAVSLFAASVLGVFGLNAIPAVSRAALLHAAPYTGSLLGAGQSLIDLDGDGFSALFLGGDCDDRDPGLNPLAKDIPGNGVDEDCSGADAASYRPVAKPSYRLPADLPARTSIVLILLDALRPDHLSFLGYSRRTTPRLERFAKNALLFENAYTPSPETHPAMASLFTGLDPRQVFAAGRQSRSLKLDDRAYTVAERLKTKGYKTFGYTISYVVHHIHGMGQGFDQWGSPWPADDWRKVFGKAAGLTTDAAIRTLSNIDDGAPYLLFTHYQCNHDPYIKHEEWDFGDRPVDKYDSASSYCDRELARLLDELESRSDFDRTAVFILSDHGELFGDHGFTNHGNSLYEADVRILLMARIPKVRPGVVSVPVLLTDVAPTLTDLAGLPSGKMTGISLFAHRFADGELEERPLFLYTVLRRGSIIRNASGVLRWPFKYIRDKRAGADELYNVDKDPEESNNLATAEKTVFQSLRAELEGYEEHISRNSGGGARGGRN